jgi:glutamate transport system substrate-binding protein
MRMSSRVRLGVIAAIAVAATLAQPAVAAKKPAKKATTTTAAPTTKAPAPAAAPTTVAAAVAASQGGATLEAIKKRGKIIIGVKQNVPLIGLKNPVTNELQGFDIEIAKNIARGIFGTDKGKIQWEDASVSANRIPFVKDGKVDLVIATFSITDARKQEVDFAGPYYVAGQDILVYKIELPNIKSVDDLNGRKVCAQSASTSLTNLKAKAPKADVLELPGVAECVEALKDGRVDAVSTDDTLLAGFAEKFSSFALVGKQFSVENYGIGLKKGDTEFRTYLNDLIEASFKDGSWKKAVDSTIGTGGIKTPAPPKVDRY